MQSDGRDHSLPPLFVQRFLRYHCDNINSRRLCKNNLNFSYFCVIILKNKYEQLTTHVALLVRKSDYGTE